MDTSCKKSRAGTILVVDDDEDTRHVLSEICQDTGFECVVAESGPAALAWLGSNPPPCLVIMDRVMPGMDGAVLLEKIHHHPGLERVPVVLVSGSNSDDIPRVLIHKNGGGELKKPVHLDDLLERIERHCGS